MTLPDSRSHAPQVHLLVLAGGKGTRLWPASTQTNPKQYLKLASERPLILDTLERFLRASPQGPTCETSWVVTTQDQRDLAQKFLCGPLKEDHVLLEPEGKNTAPSILFSVLTLLMRKEATLDDLLVVIPSDHIVLNNETFQKELSRGLAWAQKNKGLLLFGIPPQFPHTGFGYMEMGTEQGEEVFAVKRFTEKPSFDLAQKYLASGKYLWNSGLFLGTFRTFLEGIQTHAPTLFGSFAPYWEKEDLKGFEGNLGKIYQEVRPISLDYALVEKLKDVTCLRASFDWNDLGTWASLEGALVNHEGNAISALDTFIEAAKGNIIYAPNKMVSVMGLENFLIVSTDKNLLIMPKEKSSEIVKLLEKLKEKGTHNDFL